MIANRRQSKGRSGEVVARPSPALKKILPPSSETPPPTLLRAEQSNTSILFGDRCILKLFRRLQEGVNPDLQIGLYLTARGFAHVPPVAGHIEYRGRRGQKSTLGILQQYVPNQGDAWDFTLNMLDRFFEKIISGGEAREAAAVPGRSLLQLAREELPEEVLEVAGFYPTAVRLLGRRSAQMHLALSGATGDLDFAPEKFTGLYQRSLYQSMRTICRRNLSLLRRGLKHLEGRARLEAEELAGREAAILDIFRRLLNTRITAQRARCHGDYHLGQVLYTGKDFVIIDFEGEPARPVTERLIKRSPLRDVAGMLRSLHYAACTALQAAETRGWAQPENRAVLASWADYWYQWMGAVFLNEYLLVAEAGGFLPAEDGHKKLLLESYLLDKAIYELGYELNNRPDWVHIPIAGILQVMHSIDT